MKVCAAVMVTRTACAALMVTGKTCAALMIMSRACATLNVTRKAFQASVVTRKTWAALNVTRRASAALVVALKFSTAFVQLNTSIQQIFLVMGETLQYFVNIFSDKMAAGCVSQTSQLPAIFSSLYCFGYLYFIRIGQNLKQLWVRLIRYLLSFGPGGFTCATRGGVCNA